MSSMYRFAECPNCQGEVTLKPIFFKDRPEEEFAWYSRCNNCGHFCTSPSKALASCDDCTEMLIVASSLGRKQDEKMAEAEAESRKFKPKGRPANGDTTHKCATCIYYGQKGFTFLCGSGVGSYCDLKKQFHMNNRAQLVLNPNNDCEDWCPVIEEVSV